MSSDNSGEMGLHGGDDAADDSESVWDVDVVVVGACPAGASAAHAVACAGRRVLLLEKAELPRYKNLRRRDHRALARGPATRLRDAAAGPRARRDLLAQRQALAHPAVQVDALRVDQPARVRRRAGGVGHGCRGHPPHRRGRLPGRAARAFRARPAHRRRRAGRRGDRARPGRRRRGRQCQPDSGTRGCQGRAGGPGPGGGDPGAADRRRGLGGPGADRLGADSRQLRLGLPQGRHPDRGRHLGARRGRRDQALPPGLHRAPGPRGVRAEHLLRPPDALPLRRLAALARLRTRLRRRRGAAGAVDPGGDLLRAALRPAGGGVGRAHS